MSTITVRRQKDPANEYDSCLAANCPGLSVLKYAERSLFSCRQELREMERGGSPEVSPPLWCPLREKDLVITISLEK